MSDPNEHAAAKAAHFFLRAMVAHNRLAASGSLHTPGADLPLAAVAAVTAVAASMLEQCSAEEQAQVFDLALVIKRNLDKPRAMPVNPAPGVN